MRALFPVVLLAAAVAPAVSYGQVAEFWFGGGTSILSNNGIGTTNSPGTADDVKLTDGWRINFRLGLNTARFFGHEIGYAYNRTQLRFENPPPSSEEGMAFHQYFYNFLVYPVKEGGKIRPFVTGGVHLANFVPPGQSATSGGGNTKFGFNYGAGVKARLGSKFAIRFDLRQYQTGKPFDLPLANGLLRQTELSGSFGFVL